MRASVLKNGMTKIVPGESISLKKRTRVIAIQIKQTLNIVSYKLIINK